MTGDSLANLRIRVVPGPGLVAVLGEVMLVVPTVEGGQQDALEALLAAAGSAGLERGVARVFADFHDDHVPGFCLVAPGEAGGLFALVHGEMELAAEGADGGARLRGREARTWVDRALPGGLHRLAVTGSGAPDITPDPYVDLRAGVVRGSGVLITPRDGAAGTGPLPDAEAEAGSTARGDTPVSDTPVVESVTPIAPEPSAPWPATGAESPRPVGGFRPESIRFGQGGRIEPLVTAPVNGHDGHGRRSATTTTEPTVSLASEDWHPTVVEEPVVEEAVHREPVPQEPVHDELVTMPPVAEPAPVAVAVAVAEASEAEAPVPATEAPVAEVSVPVLATEAAAEEIGDPVREARAESAVEVPAGRVDVPAVEPLLPAPSLVEPERPERFGGYRGEPLPFRRPVAVEGQVPTDVTGLFRAPRRDQPVDAPEPVSPLEPAHGEPVTLEPAPLGPVTLEPAPLEPAALEPVHAHPIVLDPVPSELVPQTPDRAPDVIDLRPTDAPAPVPVAPLPQRRPGTAGGGEAPFFARTQIVPAPASRSAGVVPPPPAAFDPFGTPPPVAPPAGPGPQQPPAAMQPPPLMHPPAVLQPPAGQAEPARPRPQQGRLVVEHGPDVLVDRDCVIGRNPEVDPDVAQGRALAVTLPDAEQRISRVHARLLITEAGVDIVDVGSVNGTWIEPPGAVGWIAMVPRVPAPLPLGSRIQVGDLVLGYEPA